MADIFTIAARLLARREHSSGELRQKLQARAFQADDIEAVLARLRELNLQSDRRFCDSYIRQYQQRFGDFRLRAELAQRGITDSDITAALADANLAAESQRAAAVLEKKYPAGVRAEARQTAQRFLHSRGFNHDSIRAALAKHANEINQQNNDEQTD